MTRRLYVWLLVAALAAVALLLLVMRSTVNRQGSLADSSAVENLTVIIDQQSFDLRDGVAEVAAGPGSSATNTLSIVGDPVSGEVGADGRTGTALLLRNDPGGSGIFYYAVLAINDGEHYHATNALPLGDRIVPKGIDVTDGRFAYRFLERRPGEPMAAEPSVEKTVVVRLDPAGDRISAVS